MKIIEIAFIFPFCIYQLCLGNIILVEPTATQMEAKIRELDSFQQQFVNSIIDSQNSMNKSVEEVETAVENYNEQVQQLAVDESKLNAAVDHLHSEESNMINKIAGSGNQIEAQYSDVLQTRELLEKFPQTSFKQIEALFINQDEQYKKRYEELQDMLNQSSTDEIIKHMRAVEDIQAGVTSPEVKDIVRKISKHSLQERISMVQDTDTQPSPLDSQNWQEQITNAEELAKQVLETDAQAVLQEHASAHKNTVGGIYGGLLMSSMGEAWNKQGWPSIEPVEYPIFQRSLVNYDVNEVVEAGTKELQRELEQNSFSLTFLDLSYYAFLLQDSAEFYQYLLPYGNALWIGLLTLGLLLLIVAVSLWARAIREPRYSCADLPEAIDLQKY